MAKRHKITVTKSVLLPGGASTAPQAVDLDLPEGFSFELQKSVEELNEVNEIKRQGALGFSLPSTPTNDEALQRFRTPASIDNTFEALPCAAWVGHVKLPFEKLEILRSDDRTPAYEAELTDADRYWIELAAETKLRDLDLGEETFSVANVENLQQFNSKWVEGDPLIWTPLLDIGNGGGVLKVTEVDTATGNGRLVIPDHNLPLGTNVELLVISTGTPPTPLVSGQVYLFGVVDADQIALSGDTIETKGNGDLFLFTQNWSVKDTRPLFSVPGLFKTAFQQIGWQLTGDVLETDWCARLWDYILAPDFWDNDGNKGQVGLSLEKTGDQSILTPLTLIEFENIVADDGNNILTSSGNNIGWQNNTGETVKIRVSISLILENQTGSTQSGQIYLVFEDLTPIAFQNIQNVSLDAGETQTLEFSAEWTLKPGKIAFLISGNLDLMVKAGSTFEVELLEFKGIFKNAVIPLNQLIHPDYTLLDRFKGFLHLGDFKLQTNLDTKIITVYPSENSDVHGEEIDGFWKPTYKLKDMSARVEPRSRIVQMREKDAARFVSLRFKETSDDYITEILKLPEETPLHSRLLDLGEKFKGKEILEIENPFYEPTAEHRVGGVTVPALWDNADYEASFNIKPRIFFAVGWVEQRFEEGTPQQGGTNSQINVSHYFFEGTEKNDMPYASQLPGVEVWDGASQYLPLHNSVYGTQETDLFTMFWDKGRFVRATLPEFSFLVRLTLEEYMAEDFRQRWYINYRGEAFVYRLRQMKGHNTADDSSTDCLLQPEPNFTT